MGCYACLEGYRPHLVDGAFVWAGESLTGFWLVHLRTLEQAELLLKLLLLEIMFSRYQSFRF